MLSTRITLSRHLALKPGGTIFARGRYRLQSRAAQQLNAGNSIWKRGLLTESYATGPTEPPLLNQRIEEHLSSIVKQHGDRPAVISRWQKSRLTYQELDARSNALAQGLRELGVDEYHHVAVSLGNSWEFAVLTYALYKLNAVLVPLNPAFNTREVLAALNSVEAKWLIMGRDTHLPYGRVRNNEELLGNVVGDLQKERQKDGIFQSPTVSSLRGCVLVENRENEMDSPPLKALTPFKDLIDGYGSYREKQIFPQHKALPDDIGSIQFTSGTTSAPKAALLKHIGLLNNGYQIGDRMALTPSDVVCCPPPLFHCFGAVLGYMATATHGSAIVFPSPAFDPVTTLRAVQEERATALYGVSTMFVAELDLLANGTIERKGFEHLRTGIAAGSSVPEALMLKLHKEFNLTGLTISYGMTETSPVSFMTTPDDPLEKRVDSVGRLLPHVTAKIVSEHDPNVVLPIGQQGELAVSGYSLMRGYYKDEVQTLEVLRSEKDGKQWMYTGDEASMDAEGYVKITGRIKDLIIRGGENIHPPAIENVIFQCEGVGEVSVVGVKDDKYGEVVAAFVTPKQGVSMGSDADGTVGEASFQARVEKGEKEGVLTKEVIRSWVREHSSAHLVPKYVWWIDELPKTASGKIQKFHLRAIAEKALKEKRDG